MPKRGVEDQFQRAVSAKSRGVIKKNRRADARRGGVIIKKFEDEEGGGLGVMAMAMAMAIWPCEGLTVIREGGLFERLAVKRFSFVQRHFKESLASARRPS